MGKCLEFALATTVILVINSLFAMWVGSVVANRVKELFTHLIEVLS